METQKARYTELQTHSSAVVKDLHVARQPPASTETSKTSTKDDLKTNTACNECAKNKGLLDVVEAQYASVREKEFPALKAAITSNIHLLANTANKFGKKLYYCGEEISAKIAADAEVRCVNGTGLSFPMDIRRLRYEMEAMCKHHFDWLKQFGKRLADELPAAGGIAASIVLPTVPPPQRGEEGQEGGENCWFGFE